LSAIGGSSVTDGGSTQGARVFVVEDDTPVRELVQDRLERDGYQVKAFSDGPGGLEATLTSAPDVVILDLTLPTIDGLDVLSAIRRVSDVPVIVLTARSDETDRIVGLRMGADDYVVKPFSPRELAARVGAVLRRTRRASPSRRLEFPGLVIDQASHEVFVDDVEAVLTSKEFELLNFLASSPRQVFSRQQLLNQIWRSEPGWQDSATITEHVYRLRKKIEHDPGDPRWIATVRGAGYRFEPQPAHDGLVDGVQH
jgi:DNA-binding response OmpR family regulator